MLRWVNFFSGIRSTRSVDEGRAVFRYLRKIQSNTVRTRLTIRQVTIGKWKLKFPRE